MVARLGVLIAIGAVVLGALAVSGAVPPDRSGGRTPGPPPKVFAFVSSVGGREITRLERFGVDIDVAAPNWYALDTATGRLRGTDARTAQRLLDVTRPRGVSVWPTVNARTGGASSWERAAARARIVRSLEMAALAIGASGVTLDMEELRASQRDAFTALVGAAAQRLHAAGRQLAVYVPRPGRGHAAAYDWAALAQRADLLLTAGYNEHWSGGPPGPIATTDGFSEVVDTGLKLAGPSKAVPLLGAFGYRWRAGASGEMLSSIEADRLRRKHHLRSATADGERRFRVGRDVVYYETASGLRRRARAARAAGAEWIGLFSLGREPIAFWRHFSTHRRAERRAAARRPPALPPP
jgi:spore germination protein YaaH